MLDYKVPSILEIEEEMLNNISDDYVKESGTFTKDLITTYAIEAYKFEKKLQDFFKKLDIYNLAGEELTRFVEQRKGLHRKKANEAKCILTISGTGLIRQGDIFETEGGIRFKAIENTQINNAGNIKVVAVIPGVTGNVGANTITLMPVTIQGITSITNKTPAIDGYDEENDDSLRERYLIEIQKPATSGNIYHYMQWGREVQGVGDVRVFPLWNGNNTVQMLIIDDNKVVANEELINRVQEYVDPKGHDNSTWGTGAGQAPIGAYCTVASAIAKTININCTLVLEKGYELEPLKPKIELEIKKYLKSIAFKKNTVSYALLSSWILNIEGIQEWTLFTINGLQENIQIQNKEVAVLGSVTLNVA